MGNNVLLWKVKQNRRSTIMPKLCFAIVSLRDHFYCFVLGLYGVKLARSLKLVE